jgi:hypothetical protein
VAHLSPGDYVQLRDSHRERWGVRWHSGQRGFVQRVDHGTARISISGFLSNVPIDNLILLVKGENG